MVKALPHAKSWVPQLPGGQERSAESAEGTSGLDDIHAATAISQRQSKLMSWYEYLGNPGMAKDVPRRPHMIKHS